MLAIHSTPATTTSKVFKNASTRLNIQARSLATRTLKAEAAKHRQVVRERLCAINLPSKLDRPTVGKQVDIQSLSPQFEGVPVEYAREKLASEGLEMLRVVSEIQAQLPNTGIVRGFSQLPTELTLVIEGHAQTHLPTHLLALTSRSNPAEYTLVPTHSLALFLHSAALTPSSFPPSKPSTSNQCTLPVVPLSVPSPSTYPTLQAYLYTKDLRALIQTLFAPLTSIRDAPESRNQIIASVASHIHGVWGNACALKIEDDALWNALNAGWTRIVQSLKAATA